MTFSRPEITMYSESVTSPAAMMVELRGVGLPPDHPCKQLELAFGQCREERHVPQKQG